MADGILAAGETLYPDLDGIDLQVTCGCERFRHLDMMESYFRCTQYDARRYTWDGNRRGYDGESDIAPGWYVPLKLRRPSARYDLPRLIVGRPVSRVKPL